MRWSGQKHHIRVSAVCDLWLCIYIIFSVCCLSAHLNVCASDCLCVCVSVRSAVGQCVSVRLVAAPPHRPENVASPISAHKSQPHIVHLKYRCSLIGPPLESTSCMQIDATAHQSQPHIVFLIQMLTHHWKSLHQNCISPPRPHMVKPFGPPQISSQTS